MRQFLRSGILLCLAMLAISICGVAPVAAAPAEYKEGEVIVSFKDADLGAKSMVAAKASTSRTFKSIGAQQITLPAGKSVIEAVKELREDPNVLYAEPNYLVKKLSVPNDTRFGEQWNLTQISASAAWDKYTGPANSADSVIVAVLDTGVAYDHPDLRNNLWKNPGEICDDGIDNDGNGIVDDCYGANFGGKGLKGDPWDDDTKDSHGTHLSGIIGAVANNGTGVAGINWRTRIMAVKFLHGDNGYGSLSDALLGVEYALNKGAKIINMSFEVASDDKPMSLEKAINKAADYGVLVVSAAGNGSKSLDNAKIYPASYRTWNNIVVAASDHNDKLSGFSNYGRTTVDIVAPGGTKDGLGVLSTVWLSSGNKRYGEVAGSSMAAPHVAGAAALLWNKEPNLTARQVKARILNGVDKLSAYEGKVITGGRLNLYKVLDNGNSGAMTVFNIVFVSRTVTIEGVGFGSQKGTVKLTDPVMASKASDGNLEILSWSDTQIKTKVPAGITGGKIQVTNANGEQSSEVPLPSESTETPAASSSGGGGGGGCFIATAAWGTTMHPKVALLRDFRDNCLLTNNAGKLLVKAYYAVSPPVADYIRQHESLRTATRFALTPLVFCVEYPLLSALLVLMMLIALLSYKLTKADENLEA